MAAYAATKSFVLSWSEEIRYELKNDQVQVLAICPGATETKIADPHFNFI
jgi:short-subunit dehydrogenase